MNRISRNFLIVAAWVLFTTAAATADPAAQPNAQKEGPELRARDVLGARVGNSGGATFGHISDLLVNLPSGAVVFALVSEGENQASDGQVRLLPFEQLTTLGPISTRPSFALAPDSWEKAPTFKTSREEDLKKDNRFNEAIAHTGSDFSSQHLAKGEKHKVNSPPPNVVRVSRFLDQPVVAAGALVGHAADFMINLKTRDVGLLINRDKSAGDIGPMLTVPLSSFMVETGNNRALSTPRTLADLQSSQTDASPAEKARRAVVNTK